MLLLANRGQDDFTTVTGQPAGPSTWVGVGKSLEAVKPVNERLYPWLNVVSCAWARPGPIFWLDGFGDTAQSYRPPTQKNLVIAAFLATNACRDLNVAKMNAGLRNSLLLNPFENMRQEQIQIAVLSPAAAFAEYGCLGRIFFQRFPNLGHDHLLHIKPQHFSFLL
jgi:hypothetical protein